ncbi:MAG: hypothetical protein WC933_00875 [Candidatus Paceibacterota bacterium]
MSKKGVEFEETLTVVVSEYKIKLGRKNKGKICAIKIMEIKKIPITERDIEQITQCMEKMIEERKKRKNKNDWG